VWETCHACDSGAQIASSKSDSFGLMKADEDVPTPLLSLLFMHMFTSLVLLGITFAGAFKQGCRMVQY